MEQIHIAQLLLNLGKNDKQILGLLHFMYLEGDTDKGVYRVTDLSNFTGIESDSIVNSLNNLTNKNICGKIVYGNSVVEREIVKDFGKKFKEALGDNIKDIIDHVGFYILDGETVYVYNICQLTWYYPTWKKIGKQVNAIHAKIENELTGYLIENKNNPDVLNTGDVVNGWAVKKEAEVFLAKYKEAYNVYYNMNWTVDYAMFKAVLRFLDKNNLDERKLHDFFDYSFKRAKAKKFTVSLGNLQYSANEYILEVRKIKDKNKFQFDVDGKLRRVTN